MTEVEEEINVQLNLAEQVIALQGEIDELKAASKISYIVKTTAGDPPEGWSGLFVENRSSNTLRVYTEGAFRTVISW